jgi:hypothetical protein
MTQPPTAFEAMREALKIVVNLLDTDLETHFGDKIGKKIRDAIALAEAEPQRSEGQQKLVYNKQTRTIDKVPVNPDAAPMKSAEYWIERRKRLPDMPLALHIMDIQQDAVKSVGVKEGWQLVPIEPTEGMLKSGLANIGKWPVNSDGSVSVREQLKSDYAAMLSAAPKAEE